MKESCIFSIFLDKDLYFDKDINIDSRPINNLADIISFYLEKNHQITHILIAGGCYGRNKKGVEKLCKSCFSETKDRGMIFKLIRKYRFFDYEPTNEVLKEYGHSSYPSNKKEKSDHRKMIFFLSYNEEEKNSKKNKKDLSEYLVEGILMGSSNFSHNTYLKDTSSEADILLLRCNESSNNKFIEIIKDEIMKNRNEEFINSFIVSKSLNSNKFLQEIFKSLNLQDVEFIEI